MANSIARQEARTLLIMSDLNLRSRVDDYSVQLMCPDDPMTFVRIEPDRTPGAFVVTDLNNKGWSVEQEAAAIELALRLGGAGQIIKLGFSKPNGVRGLSTLAAVEERGRLAEVLRVFAHLWPAFVSLGPIERDQWFGVEFYPE